MVIRIATPQEQDEFMRRFPFSKAFIYVARAVFFKISNTEFIAIKHRHNDDLERLYNSATLFDVTKRVYFIETLKNIKMLRDEADKYHHTSLLVTEEFLNRK